MAQPTNTFDSYDAVGIREDLSDVITNISPEETPFFTKCRKTTARNTLVEWQTDALRASAANAHIEGDETTANAMTATVRLNNRTQIFKNAVTVPDTDEGLDKAGRQREIAYQVVKIAKEQKLDIEKALFDNNAKVAGNSTTARELAGAPSWLTSNITNTGTGGADPTGDGTDARTDDGTPAAFTETMLKTAMQSAYTSGGKPTILMTGPFNKTQVSGFAGIAAQRYMAPSDAPTTIIGAADVYLSDFGSLSCVVNLFQRERDAFLLDPELAEIAVLRPIQTVDLAKTGDATRKMVIGEMGLQVTNEAGHAGVFDLTTS